MEELHNSLCARLFLRVAPIDRFDPQFRLYKPGAGLLEFFRESGLLDVFERSASLHCVLDDLYSVHKHLVIGFQVGVSRYWSVAGNKFGVRRDVPDERADVIYQTLNAASAFKIDERETSGEKIIAEVHNV